MRVTDNLVFGQEPGQELGQEFERGLGRGSEQKLVVAGSFVLSVVPDMLTSGDQVSEAGSSPDHSFLVLVLVLVCFHLPAPQPRC